ncbi:MAG: hypothetical protein K0Q79_2290 [Flavipsychrobacter sp.]|jgi:hypothetical protein|nr:hypothetical protein [Flavipsychrobacter sp.]
MTYLSALAQHDLQLKNIPKRAFFSHFTPSLSRFYTLLDMNTKHITPAHSAFHLHPQKIINRKRAIFKIIPFTRRGYRFGIFGKVKIYSDMVTIEEFRSWALAFPDAEELPHFNIPSFRYKKKVFATYWEKDNRAMLKLPLTDQDVFCSYKEGIFFPVDGFWGKQGATFVELKKVRKDMFKDALALAYNGVALNGKKQKKQK